MSDIAKYVLSNVINIETGEVKNKRIGQTGDFVFPVEVGSVCLFSRYPSYSILKTTTVQEVICQNDEKVIFETKNSVYTFEKVGE